MRRSEGCLAVDVSSFMFWIQCGAGGGDICRWFASQCLRVFALAYGWIPRGAV